jgi:glycosyltransferase involved in cell wall biosynthesis
MLQEPLSLLCIEPRFPGRLGPIADWLVRRRGYRCEFYFHSADPQQYWPESVGKGLDLVYFNVGGVAREASVHWTRHLERGLCYAYGCWEVVHARRPSPVDLVLGRSAGLGSTLFARVHFPRAPMVNLFDYYYRPHENDLAGESVQQAPVEYSHWRRSAVATDLLDLENGVIPWTFSAWQRDLFPREYRDDFRVLFDGVDTRRFERHRERPRTVAGRTIPPDTRVVSFVARRLDRTRGFERFVQLANRLLRARADVICIAAGGSPVDRGLDVQFYGSDYGAWVLGQTPVYDPERLWLLGAVAPSVVAELLAASDLHVYPSRPFVVSHSLIEAMSAGCVVLASDDAPVREFISHGHTGLVVPAADEDAWEDRALAVLDAAATYRPIGESACRFVRETYAREVTLPQLASWFANLVHSPPTP